MATASDGIYVSLDDINAYIPRSIWNTISTKQKEEIVRRLLNRKIAEREAEKLKLDKIPYLKYQIEQSRMDILAQAYLDTTIHIGVSLVDVKEYYKTHQEEFVRQNDEVHIHHIVIPTKELADSALKLIDSGVPFDSVANVLSSDTGNIDLGFVTKDDITPSLARAAFTTPVGHITEPIKTNYGYHIIYVLASARAGTIRPIESVREEIENTIFSEKYEQAKGRLMDSLSTLYGATVDTMALKEKL